MDELDMDYLELPDIDDLDNDDAAVETVPDAFADGNDNEPEVSGDYDYDLSSISIASLSEMDGSEIDAAAPAPKEEKPKEAKPVISDMGFEDAVSAKPAPSQPSQSVKPSSGSYTPVSSGYSSTSPTSSYSSVSGGRTTSSMDELYNARFAVNDEKYEKGRKKARIVGGVGIALYGYSTLTYLISLLSYFNVSDALDLILSGFLLYLFIRFFSGSSMAKDTLGYIIGIHIVKNIIGLFGAGALGAALSGTGLGGIAGVLAVTGIISLVVRIVLAYFLILDEDITEYSKNKQ